jgi:predicted HicB family RNase H-like nuclease
MSKEKRTLKNIQIPEKLHGKVRVKAATEHKKIYEVVEDALNQYLNDDGKSQDKKPEGIGVII